MFNSNDYPKNKAYRSDKMREAARDHLAKEALSGSTSHVDFETFFYTHHRTLIFVVLTVLAMLTLFALPRGANAQNLADSGNDNAAPAIMAYRIGHYYYLMGDYDRAIEEYTKAIEGMPQEVFEASTDYAVMYWDMGDALLMAGQYDEALASYQYFVELMDGTASAKAIEFVSLIEDGIAQQMVNLTPLTS